MHKRIHYFFAEDFMSSLDDLRVDGALKDQMVFTRVEIILGRDGQIAKMGVLSRSGVRYFDEAALESVQLAAPFDPPPPAILSTDGRVYVTWEFHRDPVFACSTINARSFLLKVKPALSSP
jgi:TonB family protein